MGNRIQIRLFTWLLLGSILLVMISCSSDRNAGRGNTTETQNNLAITILDTKGKPISAKVTVARMDLWSPDSLGAAQSIIAQGTSNQNGYIELELPEQISDSIRLAVLAMNDSLGSYQQFDRTVKTDALDITVERLATVQWNITSTEIDFTKARIYLEGTALAITLDSLGHTGTILLPPFELQPWLGFPQDEYPAKTLPLISPTPGEQVTSSPQITSQVLPLDDFEDRDSIHFFGTWATAINNAQVNSDTSAFIASTDGGMIGFSRCITATVDPAPGSFARLEMRLDPGHTDLRDLLALNWSAKGTTPLYVLAFSETTDSLDQYPFTQTTTLGSNWTTFTLATSEWHPDTSSQAEALGLSWLDIAKGIRAIGFEIRSSGTLCLDEIKTIVLGQGTP